MIKKKNVLPVLSKNVSSLPVKSPYRRKKKKSVACLKFVGNHGIQESAPR